MSSADFGVIWPPLARAVVSPRSESSAPTLARLSPRALDSPTSPTTSHTPSLRVTPPRTLPSLSATVTPKSSFTGANALPRRAPSLSDSPRSLSTSPTVLRRRSWNVSVDGEDGWSSGKGTSPSSLRASRREASSTSSAIAESAAPPLYMQVFEACEPLYGFVELPALRRVLEKGDLRTEQVDKILDLVVKSSASTKVSRQEFYVGLALLAFAQQSRELSIVSIAALSVEGLLPLPELPASLLRPRSPSAQYPPSPITPPRSMSEDNAWGAPPPPAQLSGFREQDGGLSRSRFGSELDEERENASPFGVNILASTAGVGYGEEGWTLGRQEQVQVREKDGLSGVVFKHHTWLVASEKGLTVERRYSEFVWLQECLVKRYPFRLLPALPPKRIQLSGHYLATDDLFLERRRRGLERFLTFAVNHPVLQHDGLLNTFLTEQTDISVWKKSHPISLAEESTSRSLTPQEESAIPSDLEDKLAQLRTRLPQLVDNWTRVTATFDRIAHRRLNQGTDWARLREALDGAREAEGAGWRVRETEEVEREEQMIARGAQKVGDGLQKSAKRAIDGTTEDLKRHRELYLNAKELFVRHAVLSQDTVDKLKKRSEVNLHKLDSLRSQPPPSVPPTATAAAAHSAQLSALANTIEADHSQIEAMLKRRVFVRHCMWNEMLYLFRSTSLLKAGFRKWVAEEVKAGEEVAAVWKALEEELL